MRLNDFLAVRLVDVIVHGDDLASSVSLPSPTFSEETNDAMIALFVGMARSRHGDIAVIRAFTRRERDGVHALQIF